MGSKFENLKFTLYKKIAILIKISLIFKDNMKFKIILGIIVLAISSFVGWNLYGYFFSNSLPKFTIKGIKDNSYYCGSNFCTINGQDEYKVSSITVLLDDKVLVPEHKINKKEFEYSFDIPFNTLTDGEHNLTIKVENGTYNKKQVAKNLKFNVDNIPLQADFFQDKEDVKVSQGRTLHIKLKVNKPIEKAIAKVGNIEYNCFPESEGSLIYECYIPIDCEENPNEYLLNISLEDRVGNSLNLKKNYQVLNYPFKRQKINIKNDKIKEENKLGKPEKELEEELQKLALNSPKKKLWQGDFVAPTEILQITTEFGVTRITPERGLRQHKALDIYNTPKAPIWAAQDGIIALKDRFAHSGKTIAIDHGYGLLTLYYHLDDYADVEVGEKIKKGHKVGTLGKTGYATGYHLHWEMRLNNIAIDPMQWVKSNF